MSPDQAATELDKRLRPYKWYLSVGVGETGDEQPALFLYVKSLRHREIRDFEQGWKGYRVIVRAVGSIRPVLRPRLIA